MKIPLLNYFSAEEIYVKVNDYDNVLRKALVNRNKLPSHFIDTIRQKSGLNLAKLQKVMDIKEINNITTHIKVGRFGKYLKIPLKFNIDENWFYISELIRTDGHIQRNFEVKLINKNKCLLVKFENFCKSVGINYIRKDRELCYYRYRIFNSTLAFIFNKIFEIQTGNKSKIVYMPNWIKQINKNFLSKALRGAFDGDGTVQNGTEGTRRLRLNTGSPQYAKDIQDCLSKFDISSKVFKDLRKDKSVWYVEFQRKLDLLRFKESIGFLHTERAKKLQNLLNSYKRFGFGEFEIELKKLLNDKGKLNIIQISEFFNKTSSTISDHIMKLEKGGIIKTEKIGVRKFVRLTNKNRSPCKKSR